VVVFLITFLYGPCRHGEVQKVEARDLMPYIHLTCLNALRNLWIKIGFAHGLLIDRHLLKLLDPEHFVFSELVSEAVL
jgi:hypothetical protein